MVYKGHNYSGLNDAGLCNKCGKKHTHPMLGKHHSEETKRKLSYPRTEEHKRKISKSKIGGHHTEEHKYKIGVSLKGKYTGSLAYWYNKTGSLAPRYGKTCPNPNGIGKCGKRPDLNKQFFRSTWEANFARVLNLLDIKWQYEPKRFYFDKEGITYLPDFYLPKSDLYIELSGHIFPIKNKKIQLFRTYFPNKILVHITEYIWNKYFEPCKELINGWEY